MEFAHHSKRPVSTPALCTAATSFTTTRLAVRIATHTPNCSPNQADGAHS